MRFRGLGRGHSVRGHRAFLLALRRSESPGSCRNRRSKHERGTHQQASCNSRLARATGRIHTPPWKATDLVIVAPSDNPRRKHFLAPDFCAIVKSNQKAGYAPWLRSRTLTGPPLGGPRSLFARRPVTTAE